EQQPETESNPLLPTAPADIWLRACRPLPRFVLLVPPPPVWQHPVPAHQKANSAETVSEPSRLLIDHTSVRCSAGLAARGPPLLPAHCCSSSNDPAALAPLPTSCPQYKFPPDGIRTPDCVD